MLLIIKINMEQKIGTQSKKKSVSFTPSTEGCGMSSEPNKDKETNERENRSQEGVSSPENDQPKTAILKNKTLSRDESREIVNSLRESLESTPHSDVNKNSTETPESKGPRWRVVIPVVCLIAISLIVVIDDLYENIRFLKVEIVMYWRIAIFYS